MEPFGELIPKELRRNSFEVLAVELPHLEAYTRLPLYHRDPFDRMIVAQARHEELPVVGRDQAFERY